MLKKLASLKSLVILSLCLVAAGTNAEVFEFCTSGPQLIVTKCPRICTGDDATCRFVTGTLFWCETGWGICEEQGPVAYEFDYQEFYCSPYFVACQCTGGTVIDEGIQWVYSNYC